MPISKSRTDCTERIGVSAVQSIIAKMHHIFREQFTQDMGIDAQIEIVDAGRPTGKLIGVQIKTGSSHFRESAEGFVYYGDNVHLDYWLGHSLPVILVGHLPTSNLTIWASVTDESVTRTDKGWKIIIPRTQLLGPQSVRKLEELAEGTPAQRRIRSLSLDAPLMKHIADGGKVSLEMERWLTKTLNRTPIQVFLHDEDGNEILEREWFQYYVGYTVEAFLKHKFPWADAYEDELFYDLHSETDYDSDWGDSILYPRPPTNKLRPYKEIGGEVEVYRIELVLNDLGKSFLKVSDFMSDGIVYDED